MSENQDLNKTKAELTWLENLQRNSWEPEVIISGIILAFLFAFPSKIYAFSARLIQDVGLHFVGGMLVLLYLSAIISVFKIFFVVHLALRFIWAGLLGLSYAFPEGVINEKLFKMSQNYNYKKPGELVLQMERICSMTFAYPISQVFIILVFTVYLGILLFVYIWLDISFVVIYFIFLASILLFVILQLASKKSKWKEYLATTMMGSVTAIYQSNLGKWFSTFYTLVIFAFAVPLIYEDVRDFSMFNNKTNLLEREREWPTKGLTYAEFHDEESRYPRIFLPKETVESDLLRVGVARYQGDTKTLKDLNDQFRLELDSMGWHVLEDTPDLYRFYLNDQIIKPGAWRRNRIQITDQKVYETTFDITGLEAGIHSLRVEKVMLNYSLFSNKPEQILLREYWDELEFIKK
ncbi:hypothetical protein [Algoriphagus sediminis]|uniref:Uncharacterized protein n=1 Tax=Algoriphagus sediminis TaxID=3057113 RepID=A0ABT7YBZ6_9BACT|nr:hypothetical protein [Algoriphagus sediminis]MDN3204049.1 hypothetical protein [Algoriphagus sediminis]